ncbi:MAG: ferrous iron transport protein A [Coriobacteriia bacterium]|nr:ferrous iron transport protein A [Coriobacteriia bacterium]
MRGAWNSTRPGFGPGGPRRGRGPGRRRSDESGTIAALTPGEQAVIGVIDDDRARAQALRFGMGEGATVECVTAIASGPVIVRSGRQEIAVGRGLARRIRLRASEVA